VRAVVRPEDVEDLVDDSEGADEYTVDTVFAVQVGTDG
jgi:hypothetical protein